jgi:exonuclease SbcD
MRLLHTSDWHLGRTLHGLDLLEAQQSALEHIVATARAEAVDAVLVSGDVYDRAVPPIEAVRLFSRTVGELASFTQVVVSSGNHDSAVRLGALAEVLTDRLHIRTRTDRLAEPVELADEWGPVLVYAVPYLDPETVRHELGGDEPLERSHAAVLGAALDRVRANLAERRAAAGSVRSVVMAHAFVAGRAPAQTSDSERDLRVGGVEVVPTDVFDGVDYSALGHLHGAQEPRVDASGHMRYSGSPLRYSFSEAGQAKSVTLVDLGPDGVKSVSTVPVPQPREMIRLTGTLAELCDEGAHAEHTQSWVMAVITDAVRPDRMFDTLRARFPHLLSAHHVPAGEAAITLPGAGAAVDPMDVLARFLADASALDEPDPDHLALVRDQLEALWREEASA